MLFLLAVVFYYDQIMFFFLFLDHIHTCFRFLQEGKVEAEEFTEQLYEELKSTPQPCLVPFLKVISQFCAGKKYPLIVN